MAVAVSVDQQALDDARDARPGGLGERDRGQRFLLPKDGGQGNGDPAAAWQDWSGGDFPEPSERVRFCLVLCPAADFLHNRGARRRHG